MISQKMQDALNAHVTAELYSANLYLAMSSHCDARSYKGFGRWLRVQYFEELDHAHKILDWLVMRGGAPGIGAVKAPPREFGSMLQLFEAVLEHERHVTQSIDELHRTAVAEKDTAAQVFAQWFVSEQVEEEANVQEIVEKLRMIGDKSSAALYL
ncbi:MAG: Ferritin Dps family protein, partial [Anaeromyxobacteraceae bacterium]|nr:Ferritin Dps family protein [Anaeromyxobacteraceae bacterium]